MLDEEGNPLPIILEDPENSTLKKGGEDGGEGEQVDQVKAIKSKIGHSKTLANRGWHLPHTI